MQQAFVNSEQKQHHFLNPANEGTKAALHYRFEVPAHGSVKIILRLSKKPDLADPLAGLGSLYTTFGDLSGYPLDGPVPDDAIGKLEIRSISAQLRERVRKEKPTIRELYLRSGITGSARIGTPSDIADAMQEWFENGACDGFNITPAHLPGGCEDFVELVVPELQRRGLFRAEYEGKTLRENLGLKRPVSRYAAAGLDRNLDAAK